MNYSCWSAFSQLLAPAAAHPVHYSFVQNTACTIKFVLKQVKKSLNHLNTTY